MRIVQPIRSTVSSEPGHSGRDATDPWWLSLWPVGLSLFLAAAAAFPYVAVGKTADLRSLLSEWDPRHTYLLALPLGLFLASFGRLLTLRYPIAERRLARLPVIVSLAVLVAMLLAGFGSKLYRASYEAGMIAALRKEPPPAPGIVTIVAPQLPGARVRYYESNWLMAAAYGREDWLTGVVRSDTRPIRIPEWIDERDSVYDAYLSKHIMRGFRHTCDTQIRIEGEPYGVMDVLGWVLFGANLPDALSVTQVREKCAVQP